MGESLADREAGRTEEVIKRQLELDLAGLSAEDVKNLVIAYEPIWAIGTGRTATSEVANETCGFIRRYIDVYKRQEISQRLSLILKKRGISINTSTQVSEVRAEGNEKVIIASGKDGAKKEFRADLVLSAVGRIPNFGGLDLASVGVKYTKKGIEVNERMSTNVPGIWAIGDVVGRTLLAHGDVYKRQAFTPVRGTGMQEYPPPERSSYRRIQLAVYAIKNGVDISDLSFDSGRLTNIEISDANVLEAIATGAPFQTSGLSLIHI